jgi:rhamnogalacturonyl hydrolase YesR
MSFRKLGLLAVAASVGLIASSAKLASAQQPAAQPAAPPTSIAPPVTEAKRLANIATDNAREFGSSPDDPGPLAASTAQALSPAITPAAIATAMRKVADWQLSQSQQYFTAIDKSRQLDGRIWTWAALYTGYMAAASTLGDDKYRDAMEEMGKSYNWELITKLPALPNADNMSVAQTYLELYLLDKHPDQIAPTRATLDAILAAPRVPLTPETSSAATGHRIEWWWCDALFMSPPVWARMYAATGDPKYITYLDEEFAKTTQLLYDPQAHLYSRDATYLNSKEPNGQKMFWSRGEGWVMGGLARTLEFLPKDDPARARYVLQLQQMAAAVAKLQNKDGLWSSGLLDPAAYNNQPEISGSALMTFGIAWGINNGVLDRKLYTPVVTRAWSGMLQHIYADGRLGDIQQTGAAPSTFKPSASYNYGVGGFLLAGSELHKMAEAKHPTKK